MGTGDGSPQSALSAPGEGSAYVDVGQAPASPEGESRQPPAGEDAVDEGTVRDGGDEPSGPGSGPAEDEPLEEPRPGDEESDSDPTEEPDPIDREERDRRDPSGEDRDADATADEPADRSDEVAVVSFQPESAGVWQGSVIRLRVVIRNGVDVRGVPFHVLYDPQRVVFENAQEGGFLSQAGATTFMAVPRPDAGRVTVGYSVLGATEGISGQGELAILEFRAIDSGPAQFSFTRGSVRSASVGAQQASFQPVVIQIQ